METEVITHSLWEALQHIATHCPTLQRTATTHSDGESRVRGYRGYDSLTLKGAATHCNTLQHTETHCNILQHTATRCNAQTRWREQITWTQKLGLTHSGRRCNTLQHTATHCNTLHRHDGESRLNGYRGAKKERTFVLQ